MLAVTVPIGIYAMALGSIVNGVVSTLINAYPNKLLLDYSFTEQWRDLMPALILSLVMCGAAYSVCSWDCLPGQRSSCRSRLGCCVCGASVGAGARVIRVCAEYG